MTAIVDGMLDAEIIDELGAPAIADALDITTSGVRNWRHRGIPDNRRDELMQLLTKHRDAVANSPTQGVPSASHDVSTRCDTHLVASPPVHSFPVPMAGRDGKRRADVMIAARRVQQARRHADQAASDAGGLLPTMPVRGYAARLLLLFALDFPVLTMAFVAVTQVSPIVAAGSAIALSLFLVLGSHALGGPLRHMAGHLPAWCRSLASILMIGLLLASVIWTSIDLRLKGFEIDSLASGLSGDGLVFSDPGGAALVLPPAIQWAIVRAAALVTIMATMFGIGWSYQRHAPQAAFARAESAYAKALKQYAAALHRLGQGGRVTSAALAATLAGGFLLPTPAHADLCERKTIVALVDTTTPYDDDDRAAMMPAIEQMAGILVPGQRLVIRTVRDRAYSSRAVFDRCVPKMAGTDWSFRGIVDWLMSNPTTTRAARATFFADVRQALLPELQATSAAARTALVETIGHGVVGVGSLEAVWIFSDLLESAVTTPTALLTDSASLASFSSTLPPLEGVGVHVAGIGRFHDGSRRPLNPLELGTLVDSWSGLIGSAGGKLLIVN